MVRRGPGGRAIHCLVVAGAACACLLGALASPASASFVSYVPDARQPAGDLIDYSGDDSDLAGGVDNGAANRVTVTSTDGRTITIRDPGQVVRPAAFNAQPTLARCRFSRDTAVCKVPAGHVIVEVDASPGRGNDTVTYALAGLPSYAVTGTEGGPGHDKVVGSGLSDFFTGGPGADEFIGGAGEDQFDYDEDGRSGGVSVTLDGQPGDGAPGENDYLHADVEDVFGSAGDDHLVGDDGTNKLNGFHGDDVIDGRGGNDELITWDGNDQVTGGAGDDTIEARDESPSTVECSDGDDTVYADPTDTVAADCEHVVT